MDRLRDAWSWLVDEWQWPAGSLLVGVFLIALAPAIAAACPLSFTLIYAQLPAYLLHQWEEHAGDRFRGYINARLGGGFELLTRPATFWINSLGVWALDVAALHAAVVVGPAAGLIAGYLSLLNGVIHVGQAARFREYNPGLTTAVTLLIPLGGWCVYEAGRDAPIGYHVFGVAAIVGLHLLIVVHCVRRWRSRTQA
ncbi:MAG: HXXEE domain-containing protein [Planctomycetota bacterium]